MRRQRIHAGNSGSSIAVHAVSASICRHNVHHGDGGMNCAEAIWTRAYMGAQRTVVLLVGIICVVDRYSYMSFGGRTHKYTLTIAPSKSMDRWTRG